MRMLMPPSMTMFSPGNEIIAYKRGDHLRHIRRGSFPVERYASLNVIFRLFRGEKVLKARANDSW